MRRIQHHLQPYGSVMLGFGVVILVGDAVVIALRVLGVEKGLAFYVAALTVVAGLQVAFTWIQRRGTTSEHETGNEENIGEAG
jgi:hypothetical protein